MAGNQVRLGVGVTGAKGAAGEVDKLRDKFDRLQKQGAKGFAIGAGAAITTKAFDLMGGAVSKVTDFLGDSVAAFREDQVSIASLTTALQANIKGWSGNTDAIERVIASRMKLGFSDDAQRSSLDSILAITHDVSKALDVQRIAMDLARLRGLDLATATDLVGKVAGGNIGILTRYGIVIKKGATATEALAEIQKLAAGQAEAYAKTSAGKIEAANIRIGESQEKVGEILDDFWGKFALVAAEALDGEFRHENDLAEARVRLAQKTTDELEAQAERRFGLYGDEIDAIGREMAALILSERAYKAWADGLTDAQQRSHDALAAGEQGRTAARQSFHDVGAAMDDTGDKTDDLTDDTMQLKSAQEKLEDAIQGTTDTFEALSDAMFGATISAGELAQAKKDLDEKIKEGPETKSAQDYAIWRGEVAKLEQAYFDLQAQMAREAGPKAFHDWLLKQKAALGDTNEALTIYIDRLIAAASIRLPGIPHGAEPTGGDGGTSPAPIPVRSLPRGALPAFAEGGTVPGPEGSPQVILAHGGEEVIPADGKGGTTIGGGGSMTIVLQLNGRELARAVLAEADFRRARGTFIPR